MEDTASAAPIDFARLNAEINEEVRRRRAAGDFPPGLERELDEVFTRFAPKAVVTDDFANLLDRVEETSFLDSWAPTGSRRPLGAVVKKVIAKLIGWYVQYLAQNTTVFASTMTRVARMIDERIDRLDAAVFGEPKRLAAHAEAVEREAADLSTWIPEIVDLLKGSSGRVLHTDSGDGALVAALIDAGVDAYGVEPSATLAMQSSKSALDVRVDHAIAHLELLPDDGLAGLVLSGCVDRLAPLDQITLADLAATKVAGGGLVVIIGTDPALAWAADNPVVGDLSPGRPLHAETWQHLLSVRGLSDGAVRRPAAHGRLEPLDPKIKGAATFNANLDRINELLFRERTYAVVATRSR